LCAPPTPTVRGGSGSEVEEDAVDAARDRWAEPPRDWLDELDDEPVHRRAPRRSRRLLVLAGLPWLVVLAALLLPDASDPSGQLPELADAVPDHTGPDDGAGPTASAGMSSEAEVVDEQPPNSTVPSDGDAPSDGAAGSDPTPTAWEGELADELWAIEYPGPWRSTASVEEAVALAVVVARAWLTDVDPRLDLAGIAPAGTGRYVEHLVVEAVEVPAPQHAVVTLLAVLLEGEDELAAVVRRLAVPLAFDADGAAPGGTPWWLPGPSLEARPPATTTVEDPAELLTAAEALEAAGYTDVELARLERTEGAAALATVTARTPDGDPVDGTVWLRRHLDRYVVSGLALTRAEVAR
jgi:hypothetical protein